MPELLIPYVQGDRPFCGEPIIAGALSIAVRMWPKRHLTIQGKQERVRHGMRRAARMWGEVSGLTFDEVGGYWERTTNRSDMRFSLEETIHGDGQPFDGRGGVLAHMWFPPIGDGHFELAEPWAFEPGDSGYDFDAIMLHEFGHGLGLGHSSLRSSVMFPVYYNGAWSELDPSDIAAIQAFYGEPPESRWSVGDDVPLDLSGNAIWNEDRALVFGELMSGDLEPGKFVMRDGKLKGELLMDAAAFPLTDTTTEV